MTSSEPMATPSEASLLDADRTPTLTPCAEGVWTAQAPVTFLGLRLTSTMTVLRLNDGSLVVHSPVPLTLERRGAVEALGPVAHLYAPSLYHFMAIEGWAAAFPSARVHAPATLAKKRCLAHLRVDRALGSAPEPAFAGVIDEIHVDGFRLDETVLVHRPSRTLVVTDLVHAVGRPTHGWTAFYTRTMGFYDRVALSRMIRIAAFDDRAAARRSLDDILGRDFDRVVVGHGAPTVKDALAAAYAWLPAVER